MFTTVQQFRDASLSYIKIFNIFAQKHNLVDKAAADHICFKCESKESFEALRALFENESLYIYQAIISGRRISYIKLKEGIQTVLGSINFVELSDQKPDGSQKEGFEHIEVYPTALSYEDMVHQLAETEVVTHKVLPHHTTDNVDMEGGFIFRCTQQPLLEKIKHSEFI